MKRQPFFCNVRLRLGDHRARRCVSRKEAYLPICLIQTRQTLLKRVPHMRVPT